MTRNEWDECAVFHLDSGLKRPVDPFTCYDFLRALERSRSVGEDTGWIPYHITATNQSKVIGAVPLYLKTNSQGEYIFDHRN